MTYKNDWFKKRIDFGKQELRERRILLSEHSKEWGLKTQLLHKECEEDGGHDYQDLPENGFNNPHFVTGEWPQGCSKCHKRK